MSITSSLALVLAHRRRLHRSTSASRVRERARLRAHFREVLAELEAREVMHLDDAQRERRAALLAALSRYAVRSRFPRNLDFPEKRTPYFVDAFGTRCAVAHLIESTGGAALVAQIAATMNNAFVPQMASSPALQEWSEQAGFSVEELARIQPSYCFRSNAEECFCSYVHSAVGVLEGTIISVNSRTMATARIDAVHGNVGNMTVGQDITFYFYDAPLNQAILIETQVNSQNMMSLGNVLRVKSDGTMELSCQQDVPPLTKAAAITAALAGNGQYQEPSACELHLRTLDARWQESICGGSLPTYSNEPDMSRGCSMGVATGGSPFLLATALAFATLWSWQRRRRARRQCHRVSHVQFGSAAAPSPALMRMRKQA